MVGKSSSARILAAGLTSCNKERVCRSACSQLPRLPTQMSSADSPRAEMKGTQPTKQNRLAVPGPQEAGLSPDRLLLGYSQSWMENAPCARCRGYDATTKVLSACKPAAHLGQLWERRLFPSHTKVPQRMGALKILS